MVVLQVDIRGIAIVPAEVKRQLREIVIENLPFMSPVSAWTP